MKYIFLASFFLSIFLFYDCKNKQIPKKKPVGSTNTDTTTVLSPVPIFWKTICGNSRFRNLYDCNTLECYQVELLKDPLKDLVILSAYTQDSLIDIIYYNRFSFNGFSRVNEYTNNKYIFEIPVINPVTKDTIFCYHLGEKKITIEKDSDINYFFKKTIWEMYPNDEKKVLFDPETWDIKARSAGKEIILSRHLFKDSLYYSNIQKILDICKIKDYKYENR